MKSLSCILLQCLIVLSLFVGHTPVAAQTVRPPSAVDDAETTSPGTPLTISVLANDTDPQNLSLEVVSVGAPANGTATTNGTTVVYTPISDFSGIDTFTYTISNGQRTNTATIDAIVLPPPGSIWDDDVFDPLALGPLDGQNGWTIVPGSASPVVITDPDPARGKTVQIDATPGQPINVTKDVPDQSSGRHGFSFLVKVSGTTHLPCEAAVEIQTDPGTGWSNKARFCIGASIAVNYDPSGADTTIVASVVPEQWYLIHGEVNLNTNLLDVFVDGQLTVSGIPVHPGPIRSLGITGQDQGGAGVVFVDDLIGVSSSAITNAGSGTGTPGRPVYWINPAGGLWSAPANWSTRRVPTATDHAIITLGGNYTVTVDKSDTVNSLTLGAGSGVQTLWIKGNGSGGHVTLTVNNDILNSSLIRLESQDSFFQSNLTIVNGLLINTYVISANVGSGGSRVITGRVLNRCRVSVLQDLTFKGAFTNRAILEIATGKQMSLSDTAQVFNQNGGEIGGNGLLALLNGATMNFNRGATTGTNPPTLTNAKLNFGPSATGVATFIMQGASQLSGDIGAEQTVWIRGNGQGGHTTITALDGFTNAGVIRLESRDSFFESNLTIANGVLINTGVINMNQGTGGGRIISGALVNQGAVNVTFNATFKGTFTNLSTLTIDSTRTMSLVASTDVFNQNAGTIAGNGVLTLSNGATMNFNSGATTGAAPTLTNAKLNFGPAATGVATFIMQGASQLSGDIGTEQTVWIRGNGQGGHTTITALDGFTNAGVIRLESRDSFFESNLTIANGVLINTGVINMNQGTGGGRIISGALVNQGAVNVTFNATFKGTFTNLSTLTIDSTRTMSLVVNTDVFNQNAGTIAGNGVLTLSNGATMNFNSGATTGAAPTLTNAKLNFGPTATGVATLIMQGGQSTSQLSGDIGAEQTVWIRGNGQGGHTTITALDGFTNAGVIRLESRDSFFESNLTIANGVLINMGVINMNQGTGGGRIISGALVNQGAVNVTFNATFKGTFTNLSTLTIDSTRTMSLVVNTDEFNQNDGEIAGDGVLALFNGATMNFNSGATTGAAPTLTNAKLNFGPAATGVATLIMQGGQSTSQLSGDIGAEQTVWIRGNGQGGHTTITALDGFTNAGVIRLESQDSFFQSNLTIANGVLTNRGRIDVNQGTNGNRVIAGQVDNQGRVNVNHDLSINGTFNTNGILSIGLGPANTEFDQLQVSGAAALDSTLNLDVVSGFNPPINATFQIITCNPCSGVFTTVNGRDIGNGKRLVVIYNPTNVTLQVAPEEAIAGLTATNNSPTPLDSVTTLTATLTAGSNVSYVWNFGDGTTGNGRVVTHTYPAEGNYTASVTATNTLGSDTATTAVNIFIAPITGLTASNNSPTPLDSTTILTANVTAGNNVSYAWNFGDGTTGNGRVIYHTYPAAGNYSAIVTATNTVSSATDTTEVNIFIVPIAGLTASNDSPTPQDSITTLTATVTAGSRVNYSWDFGDGTTGNGGVVTHTYPAAGNYTAIVTATNAVSTLTDTTNVIVTPTTTVEEIENEIPTSFMLSQNYPNPFNPSTTIRYAIPKAGDVTLKVYNLLGEEIETLVSEKQSAGEREIRWNPVGLPSGVYFYRLQVGEFKSTKKLVLLH